MILISAAGSGGTNRLVESVDYSNFIGISNDKYKVLASVLDKNFLVPSANDEENYIKVVNKIIKEFNIKQFIPNSDLEVFVVSKNIEKFNTKIFLPPFEFVDIMYDKLKMHNLFEKLSIPSAKTIHIKNEEDIDIAFEKLNKSPLWCRIRWGAGSKHTSKVINPQDAKYYIRHACNVYNLKIDDFLISEYLPGEDMAILTIWRDGEIKLCKMAKRTKYYTYAGESAPTVLESFYDEEVEKFVIENLQKMDIKHNGVLNVDIKCFEDGSLAITEVNAGRFYYNMQLFNYGKLNTFKEFFNIIDGKEPKYFSDDPKIVFIREQDNCPTIVSQSDVEKIDVYR